MAGNTINEKPTIEEIFETMEYGSVNESNSSAKGYFKDHESVFAPFIGGKEEKKLCRIKVFNPCNQELGYVCMCDSEVVREVVDEAAKNAAWFELSGSERARQMRRIAKELEKNQRLLAEVEAVSTGRLFRSVNDFDVPALVRSFNRAAYIAESIDQSLWKPMGVVLVTAESTNPFFTNSWQLAEILATGNSIVMCIWPHYLYISCHVISEIFQTAGLPSGVVNVLPADHRDINKWIKPFSPTQKMLQYFPTEVLSEPSAIPLVVVPKRNPTVIVFDSVDIHGAAHGAISAMCSNASAVRLLVQESVYNKFLPILKEKFLKLRVGCSMDKNADLTPVYTDESSLSSWQLIVTKSEERGAKIIKLETEHLGGWHHFPMLVENIQTSSPLVQKQALPGPAILVLPFRTSKEATALANSWAPGGEAMLWTERSAVALEVAFLLKAGSVWINGTNGVSDSRYLRQGGFFTGSWYDYVSPRKQASENPNTDAALISVCFPPLENCEKLYYGGKCQKTTGSRLLDVRGENNRTVQVSVAKAGEKDVASAIAAGRSALAGWGRCSGRNRGKFLCGIAEQLERKKQEFVNLLTQCLDTTATSEKEFELSVRVLYHCASICEGNLGEIKDEESCELVTIRREPIGVIGIVCPNEAPLLVFVTLMATAISQGNCVVIVPSEELPLPVIRLFQVFDEVSLPGGVVNVLVGSRKELYEKLSRQADIRAFWDFDEPRSLQVNCWKNYLRVEKFPWGDSCREAVPMLLAAATRTKSIYMPVGDIFAN